MDDVSKHVIPEENDPVVALFPEPSGSFAPVWVVLILEHHVSHLREEKNYSIYIYILGLAVEVDAV